MTTGAHITMAHGAGGSASRRLIDEIGLPNLGGPTLRALGDAGTVRLPDHGLGDGRTLAMTTDAFVVRPLQFSGGSIGSLAVHGTINDLAVSGAQPLALTASFILEEGLELDVLRRELSALGDAARRCDVEVIAADTKVVERGHADQMFITTTGVGLVVADPIPSPTLMVPGDVVLVSGPVADHGIAVLLARGDLHLDGDIRSDSASLWPIANALAQTCGSRLKMMRDATRGGLATVLCELVDGCGHGIEIDESAVPINGPTRGACELLGLDPLYVANEGCMVAVVAPDVADDALSAMHAHTVGRRATAIGTVSDAHGPLSARARVIAHTGFGGRRVLDLLAGDPLPRIC